MDHERHYWRLRLLAAIARRPVDPLWVRYAMVGWFLLAIPFVFGFGFLSFFLFGHGQTAAWVASYSGNLFGLALAAVIYFGAVEIYDRRH